MNLRGTKWRRSRAKTSWRSHSRLRQQGLRHLHQGRKRTVPPGRFDYAAEGPVSPGPNYQAKGMTRRPSRATRLCWKKFPKFENYERRAETPVRNRQQVPRGKMVQAMGYIPFFPSMDRTVEMYQKNRQGRALQ